MVTLRSARMFHAYGFLAKVFEILAKHKISVDLITTSEISVSLTLDQTDTAGGAPQLPQEVREELEELCSVEVEHDLCLVALIGNKMSESKGYAKHVFGTLEDFNLRMICYGAVHITYAFWSMKPILSSLFKGCIISCSNKFTENEKGLNIQPFFITGNV